MRLDNDGATPLYIAAQEGHLEVVQHLLAKEDIDVNKADNNGLLLPLFMLLHAAAKWSFRSSTTLTCKRRY